MSKLRWNPEHAASYRSRSDWKRSTRTSSMRSGKTGRWAKPSKPQSRPRGRAKLPEHVDHKYGCNFFAAHTVITHLALIKLTVRIVLRSISNSDVLSLTAMSMLRRAPPAWHAGY